MFPARELFFAFWRGVGGANRANRGCWRMKEGSRYSKSGQRVSRKREPCAHLGARRMGEGSQFIRGSGISGANRVNRGCSRIKEGSRYPKSGQRVSRKRVPRTHLGALRMGKELGSSRGRGIDHANAGNRGASVWGWEAAVFERGKQVLKKWAVRIPKAGTAYSLGCAAHRRGVAE